MRLLLLLMMLLASAVPALAQPADDALGAVKVDQLVGRTVATSAPFLDEGGHEIRFGSLLGARPLVLALVYFRCPNLCTGLLNGLAETLLTARPSVGRDFDVAVVSIDPQEGVPIAASRWRQYTRVYGRPGAAEGWHFLTGKQNAIRTLADSVGFHYRYDPKTDQYAHAASFIVLSPQGTITRYFFGMRPPRSEFEAAIATARAERPGSVIDAILICCFHYDPKASPYGPLVYHLLQAGGLAMVLAMGLGIRWLCRPKEGAA